MKCTNCEFEPHDELQHENASDEITENKVLKAIQDKLFLIITILMTASCLLSFMNGGLPLINVLITIFLWLTYSQSLKGIADENHLRCVSGAVYANYIIANVAAIILVVCGAVTAFLFELLADSLDLVEAINEEIGGMYSAFAEFSVELFEGIGLVVGLTIAFVGVIVFIISVLGLKKIHRFAQSVYLSLSEPSREIYNPHSTKNWLIFFGICSALSAASVLSSNLCGALSEGCLAAATFVSVVLIDRYLNTEK